MAIIGRFVEQSDGALIGHIRTMFFKSDKVLFEPAEPSPNAKAPAFRVYTADEIELGAAWRREAKETGRSTTMSGSTIRPSPNPSGVASCSPRQAMASCSFGSGQQQEKQPPLKGCVPMRASPAAPFLWRGGLSLASC